MHTDYTPTEPTERVYTTLPPANPRPIRHVKTLEQFARAHEAFTVAGLRWLRFCSTPGQKNAHGKPIEPKPYADCFVQIGRRLYIDEDKFFEILDRENARGAV